MNTEVIAAIANTMRQLPGYWEKTVSQRAGTNPAAAGSVYPGKCESEVEQMLLAADWRRYEHPAIMAGCEAYIADIPGQYGLVELSALRIDSSVTLDDRKNTGTISATVRGVRGDMVGFTVLVIGEDQGERVVYTFHPGAPTRPSSVVAEPGLHGQVISVAQAMDLGLQTAKIV